MTALSAIGQELNAALERERIFSVVLTAALKVTGAPHGFISLINAETPELRVCASQGYAAQYVKRLEADCVPLATGSTGRAVRGTPSSSAMCARSVRRLMMWSGCLKLDRRWPCPSGIAQSVVGALNLESDQVEAFTDEHVRFLEALASQAAIAIGNALRLEDRWSEAIYCAARPSR